MSSIPITFLGTGNFHATGGYWNSFLIGDRLLMEASPSVLRNMRLVGVDPKSIQVLFLSHFHADHTFGWPFLLLTSLSLARRTEDLWVVGPPGIRAFLENMVRAGAIDHIVGELQERGGFQIHYLEVNRQRQRAGDTTFRAVSVEHDPVLDCYGYLVEVDGRTIGYSGDTRWCDGLRQIAAASDVLVMECNHRHEGPVVHLSLNDVRTLRAEFPDLPLVLTHRGSDVDDGGIPNVRLPRDLETIQV